MYKALSGTNVATVNSQKVIRSNYGLQAVDIVQMSFGAAGWPTTQHYNNDVTDIYAGLTGVLGLKRFLFQSVRTETQLMNNSKAMAYVTLYDMIARRDVPCGQPVTGQDICNPMFAWANSLNQQVGTNGTYVTVPGQSPFIAKQFTSFFKVVSTRKFTLGPGQTHRHRVTFAPNKLMSQELDYPGGGNIKGLTIFTMVVFHGAPITTSTNQDVCSSASIELLTITTRTLTSRYILDNTHTASVNNVLTSTLVGVETLMEQDGDVSVNISA